MRKGWILFALALLLPISATATPLRLATFNASLNRTGPGSLLRAIEKKTDPQVASVAAIIRSVRPDILLVNEFDYDGDGRAAAAFQAYLAEGGDGIDYPHIYTDVPNTGIPSGFDLDRDGKIAGPRDAFGYGTFPGQYGMLLLSRYPVDREAVRTFRTFLWRDLPDTTLPINADGTPFPTKEAQDTLRLSSKSHWDIPLRIDDRTLHILASHPTPPVFDGDEDMNGLRNAAEIDFWRQYITGAAFPDDQGRTAGLDAGDFAIMGDLNLDSNDGDGRRAVLTALLARPEITDPEPRSSGGAAAAAASGGVNKNHRGNPALDTADWNDTRGPGNLRVDYVLPSATLEILDAGVFWPAPDAQDAALLGRGDSAGSDHRLVWVDIDW